LPLTGQGRIRDVTISTITLGRARKYVLVFFAPSRQWVGSYEISITIFAP